MHAKTEAGTAGSQFCEKCNGSRMIILQDADMGAKKPAAEIYTAAGSMIGSCFVYVGISRQAAGCCLLGEDPGALPHFSFQSSC